LTRFDGASIVLRVIEDEQTRREQLDQLHVHRVEQARYAVDAAERRFKHVDPANRLVAGQLERDWESALVDLADAASELDQLRNQRPVTLSASEREELQRTCADVSRLWRDHASVEDRKQVVRLLLDRVEVDVHDNTERVSVRLHWSGGFESCHEIIRTVANFEQLESYDQLIDQWGKAAEGIGSQLMEDSARVIILLDDAAAEALGEPVILPPPPKTPPPPPDPNERWWKRLFGTRG